MSAESLSALSLKRAQKFVEDYGSLITLGKSLKFLFKIIL